MTSKELSVKYGIPITLIREIALYFGIKLTAGKNGTDFTKTDTRKFELILSYIVKLAGKKINRKLDSKIDLSASAIKTKRKGGKVRIELATNLIHSDEEKQVKDLDLEEDTIEEEEFDMYEDEPDIEEDDPFVDGGVIDDTFDKMSDDEYEEDTNG